MKSMEPPPSLVILPSLVWMVITSPAAVDSLIQLLDETHQDLRRLPRILAGGPKTAARFRDYHIVPDAEPKSEYGMAVLRRLAAESIGPESRVVRFRSDKANDDLARALHKMGHKVEDCVLYHNEAITYGKKPDFDAVVFASGSAVESFVANWGAKAVEDKRTAVIGAPTADALASFGITPTVRANQATVERVIEALAAWTVERSIVGEATE